MGRRVLSQVWLAARSLIHILLLLQVLVFVFIVSTFLFFNTISIIISIIIIMCTFKVSGLGSDCT